MVWKLRSISIEKTSLLPLLEVQQPIIRGIEGMQPGSGRDPGLQTRGFGLRWLQSGQRPRGAKLQNTR